MTRQLNKVKSMETTIAYQKVIGWFFAYPLKEMSLNDLSAALNMPKTTAKKVVEQLIKEGFLNRELFGKMWKISCNQNHIYNHTRKISQNLNMIFESQILDILHDKIRNPKSVILFGSYRKGDDNEKSDIDIAVEVLGNEEMKIAELGVIPQFGFRKNVLVNLHIFSRNKIDLNLFSNISNGILLEGFLEVKP